MNYMEMWKSSGKMNLEAMQIGGFTVIDLEMFVSLRARWGVHVFFCILTTPARKCLARQKTFDSIPVSYAFIT